jgi:putative ABC transport system permease protein
VDTDLQGEHARGLACRGHQRGTAADHRHRAARLAFAILIALIGIMNTLSLSVFEHAPESATERALGLTRGQLRATLVVEALLVAVVGALAGVGFELRYGWGTTMVMFVNLHPVLTIPVPRPLAYRLTFRAGCAG